MAIVETDPAANLQRAHFAALRLDPDLVALFDGQTPRVFDDVPDGMDDADDDFPYITIGDDRVAPMDSECGSVAEVFSTVRVYSRAVGRLQAKEIAGRLRFLLVDQGALQVEGFRVVIADCLSVYTRKHEDGRTTHAEVNLKYRIQPVEP